MRPVSTPVCRRMGGAGLPLSAGPAAIAAACPIGRQVHAADHLREPVPGLPSARSAPAGVVQHRQTPDEIRTALCGAFADDYLRGAANLLEKPFVPPEPLPSRPPG